ncbi:hypothetical protein ACOMHN_038122 [Nucella lapillus]
MSTELCHPGQTTTTPLRLTGDGPTGINSSVISPLEGSVASLVCPWCRQRVCAEQIRKRRAVCPPSSAEDVPREVEQYWIPVVTPVRGLGGLGGPALYKSQCWSGN